MSKIDELIEKLCPDGVVYKSLEELTLIITKGTTPTSIGYNFENDGINFIKIESLDTNGNFDKSKFAYISNECHDKLERSKLQENDILFSIAGAIGRIAIVNKDILPANTNQALAIIRLNSPEVLVKYVAYTLKTKEAEEKYMSKKVGAAQPNVSLKNISELRIAVPPLEVQHEIVHILDDFTLLSAELSAELKARQKQYQYYFDKILNQNNYPKMKLGDIGQVKMCKRILKSQTNNIGGVPFYKIGTFGKEPDAFIDTETFEEYKEKYSYPRKGDILISCSGTIGRTVIFDGEASYFQDSNIVWLEHDYTKVLNEYLFYCYKTNPWMISTGGTIARLYNENVLKAEIPVPPIEKQKEIVDKLDRFYKMCNDISEGLPAEIEARQKQYEFYRDKLLTFKEKVK